MIVVFFASGLFHFVWGAVHVCGCKCACVRVCVCVFMRPHEKQRSTSGVVVQEPPPLFGQGLSLTCNSPIMLSQLTRDLPVSVSPVLASPELRGLCALYQ